MSRYPRLASALNVATWVVVSTAACGGVVRVEGGSQDAGSAGGWFSTESGGSGPIGAGGRTSKQRGAGGAFTSGGGAFTSSGGALTSAGGALTSAAGLEGAGGGVVTFDSGGGIACGAPIPDPIGSMPSGGACCSTVWFGDLGICALPAITNPATRAFGHAGCSSGLVCEPSPDTLAGTASRGVYASCVASLGARLQLEGRCVPKCFVAQDPQAPLYEEDVCSSADLVCAPCFDPAGGTATGACTTIPGDAPVQPAPMPFLSCGALDGGPRSGTCVPQSLADRLPFQISIPDICSSPTDVCVPTSRATHPGSCFAQCTTSLGGVYNPGACVPSFVVQAVGGAAALGLLLRASCSGPDERCAPCLDPLHAGVSSHLCD